MSLLTNLPEDIGIGLFKDWLTFPEITVLDRALVNHKQRNVFLTLLKHENVIVHMPKDGTSLTGNSTSTLPRPRAHSQPIPASQSKDEKTFKNDDKSPTNSLSATVKDNTFRLSKGENVASQVSTPNLVKSPSFITTRSASTTITTTTPPPAFSLYSKEMFHYLLIREISCDSLTFRLSSWGQNSSGAISLLRDYEQNLKRTCSAVITLHIDGTNGNVPLPLFCAVLSKCHALQHLSLTGFKKAIDADVITLLRSLPHPEQLQSLSLNGCWKLTGETLKALHVHKLLELDISACFGMESQDIMEFFIAQKKQSTLKTFKASFCSQVNTLTHSFN